MFSTIILTLLVGQTEPERGDLHDFVKELQETARPYSKYSPTTALKRKRTDQLTAAFANRFNTAFLELESTVVDVTWNSGVATVEIAPMLDRWRKASGEVPLSLTETTTIDLKMSKEIAAAILKEERITIEAHALKSMESVAGSGAPHGQFLFNSSSKRFSVSIGSYVTRNYKARIGKHGWFAGYWDQSAVKSPNKRERVDVNF